MHFMLIYFPGAWHFYTVLHLNVFFVIFLPLIEIIQRPKSTSKQLSSFRFYRDEYGSLNELGSAGVLAVKSQPPKPLFNNSFQSNSAYDETEHVAFGCLQHQW